MKIRTLAAIIAVPMFLLPVTSNAAPPTVAPAVRVAPTMAEAKAKEPTTMKVDSAMTIPGEKKTYKAVLTHKNNAPLAHKKVVFRIQSKEGKAPQDGKPLNILIGSAETDADGRATIDYAIAGTNTAPELAQGAYDVRAAFAGDDQYMASNNEANLGVFKGITELEVQHSYGTYKNEPGSPYHTLIVSLVRKVDKKALSKTLLITDNGKTTSYKIGEFFSVSVVLQPMNVAKHTVHIQFEGDDANLATGFDKVYDK